MFRKTVLAIAATAVIGVASLTPASAHHFQLVALHRNISLSLFKRSFIRSNSRNRPCPRCHRLSL